MIGNGGNEKMKNYADDGFPRYQRTRNDLLGCRMTDRPTEQIHQPEQLTNISFSNLMAVGNILEEYSFVCQAGGRYALIYAIPLFHTFFFAVVATLETISEVSLQVLCQTEIQNTCHLLFCNCFCLSASLQGPGSSIQRTDRGVRNNEKKHSG